MNDERIDRAAEFLVAMRPGDARFPSHRDRLANYRGEICGHLQVINALKLAGLADGMRLTAAEPCNVEPGDLLRCVTYGCPVCGGIEFHRIQT